MERSRNRIGLNRVSHKSKRKDQEHSKNCRQDFTKDSLKRCPDIVNRTTRYNAVFSDLLVLLRHNSFAVDRRHSEEGCYPHPKDRTRTANGDRCCGTCNITGTYLCSDCSRKSLERAHAVLAGISFFGKETSKSPPHSFLKSSYLNKSRTEREPDSSESKRYNQDVV